MEKPKIRKQKICRAYISKDAQIEALKERNEALEQRVNELIDGNKCTKEELKLVMDSADKRATDCYNRIAELEEKLETIESPEPTEEQIEQMQNNMLDEIERKKAEDEAFDNLKDLK